MQEGETAFLDQILRARKLNDQCAADSGMDMSPYFFIFLYKVTREMPREVAARERL